MIRLSFKASTRSRVFLLVAIGFLAEFLYGPVPTSIVGVRRSALSVLRSALAPLPCAQRKDAPPPDPNVTWKFEKDERGVKRLRAHFGPNATRPLTFPWRSVLHCLRGRRIAFIGDSVSRISTSISCTFLRMASGTASRPPLKLSGSGVIGPHFQRARAGGSPQTRRSRCAIACGRMRLPRERKIDTSIIDLALFMSHFIR